jgi:broad specificity phosphatase PhoE
MKSSYCLTSSKIAARPEGAVSIEIVYETHSTSVDNERGIATGWLEGELSETGRENARALGERRRDDGIAVVYCSDLGRAVETAEIAFGGSGIPMRRDRRLRECDYGELNGMPTARLRDEVPRRVDTAYPGGESYRDVVERVRDFLAAISPAARQRSSR